MLRLCLFCDDVGLQSEYECQRARKREKVAQQDLQQYREQTRACRRTMQDLNSSVSELQLIFARLKVNATR